MVEANTTSHSICAGLTEKKNSLVSFYFRQGASRYLVLAKKDLSAVMSKSATFQLVRNSRYQVNNMLQRFPVTSKERLELLQNTEKNQVNDGM